MNELNSLHRGYNFDLDRYGWHSTDYQGVLLTVARVRSTTPRYSINQLGRRCQQRCLNSGHVIRQQPSWTANVELPLFPSSECIFTAGGKSTIRRFEFRQTDRQTSTKRNRLATTHFFLLSSSFSISYIQSFLSISFSFFLFLSPHARTIFCSSRTRLSRAQRNLRSLPWHCTKTIIRFNTRTHVTRATINFIHLTTFLLLFSPPPPFLPIFYSFSSFFLQYRNAINFV